MNDTPPPSPTLRSFSQYGEDAVLLNFLHLHARIRNGVYVDVGAYDPVRYSNTYMLHRRGWSGVNIDVLPERIARFQAERPGDHNILAAVSDQPGEIDVYEHPTWDTMTTVDPAVAAQSQARVVGKVACRTLPDILSECGVDHVDYVNLDVEGFEMKALAPFDPRRYGVSLFTVELLTQDIQAVLGSPLYAYMTERGYVFCGWTGWTLFFRLLSLAL